jgi:hypothetical protein
LAACLLSEFHDSYTESLNFHVNLKYEFGIFLKRFYNSISSIVNFHSKLFTNLNNIICLAVFVCVTINEPFAMNFTRTFLCLRSRDLVLKRTDSGWQIFGRQSEGFWPQLSRKVFSRFDIISAAVVPSCAQYIYLYIENNHQQNNVLVFFFLISLHRHQPPRPRNFFLYEAFGVEIGKVVLVCEVQFNI